MCLKRHSRPNPSRPRNMLQQFLRGSDDYSHLFIVIIIFTLKTRPLKRVTIALRTRSRAHITSERIKQTIHSCPELKRRSITVRESRRSRKYCDIF